MGIVSNLLDTGPAKLYLGKKLTGTISSSTTALTGVGTAFLTELVVGQYIYEPTKRGLLKVTVVTSDTAATVAVAPNSALSAATCYALADAGDTKGGIDIEYATETYKTSTDRLGVVSEIISDRSAKVTIPLSDWKPDNIGLAMPDSLAKVVSGGKTLVRISKSVGLDLSTLGVPAAIIPIINAAETTDPNRIVVFHNLCPSAETLALKFAATEQRPIQTTFMAWALSDGEIGYVGDNTVRP